MSSVLARSRFPLLAVATLLVVVPAGTAFAADGWSLGLGLSYVDPSGHDPAVVTTGGSTGQRARSFDTESGPGYQFALRWDRGTRWSAGADFRWFTGAQKLQLPTASGSPGAPATYGITERTFTSTGPATVLYFQRLGDTDMNAWTFDVYARRRLSEGDRGDLHLVVGIRNADFDNDSHFAAGIEGVGGTRFDASSNYDRMIGPLVGLSWDRESGKHRFELGVNLAVVAGDAELSSSLTDFTGPFSPEAVNEVATETFSRTESVTIPMGDIRAGWSYAVSKRVSFGIEIGVSRWNDVSVPPGVRPNASLETLNETSITFTEAVATLGIDL